MKWNLFKKKPEAMVGPEPTGAAVLTVAPGPVASTAADNSTEAVKNGDFDDIKNKFLNEIDKIPCECLSGERLGWTLHSN